MSSAHVCLHADSCGDLWILRSQGLPARLSVRQFSTLKTVKSCRVIATPQNYSFLEKLWAKFGADPASPKFLVGSARILHKVNSDATQTLLSMALLSPHDRLSNMWHPLTAETANTFSLLHQFHVDGLSRKVCNRYASHALYPIFQFLGLHNPEFALYLLQQIVDPRWFLSVQRTHRLSRLESYFGLASAQQRQTIHCSRSMRRKNLLAAITGLQQDSWLRAEIAADLRPHSCSELWGCKLLLGFVVRNWLEQLTLRTHFDPFRFFRSAAVQDEYIRKFRGSA